MPTLPSESLFPVPRSDARSLTVATRLWYLALVVFLLHLALVAAGQWLVYGQFVARSLVDVRQPLAEAFRAHGLRTIAIELLLLGAARLAIVGIRRVRPLHADVRMLATAGLLAYTPVVLFGAGTLVAFMAGWQLDVWILPAGNASDREIAATIREALPIVLEPLTLGRQIANAVGVVLFGWLQYRLCRIRPGRAAIHAMVAGGIVIGGYAYAWSA